MSTSFLFKKSSPVERPASHISRRQRGDTIIEVLIAVAIISLVLVTAYATTNHNTVATQDIQEGSQATQLLRSQAELLRLATAKASDDTSGVFAYNSTASPRYFCMTTAGDVQPEADISGALPAAANDDFSKYAGQCQNVQSRYNVAITYNDTTKVFVLSARWDKLGGGRNQQTLFYRLTPGLAFTKLPPCVGGDDDIALVLDTSKSMEDAWSGSTRRIDALQQVANSFVDDSNVASATNNEAIVSFNTSATLAQPLTSDAGSLHSAINAAVLNRGSGTHYVQAMNAAMTALNSGRSGHQKDMVFISDGKPNDLGDETTSSTYAVDNVPSGVRLYTIYINGDTTSQDNGALQGMAIKGGGTYFRADSPAELQIIVDQLAAQLSCS